MNTNTIFENENITIRRNLEKHGIEVMFPSRPSEFERQLLKNSGFRWSNPQKLWWARESRISEKYIENEIERQNGLKKIKDWEEFTAESKENTEIQHTALFSPESFLAGFNQDVQKLFDNNQFVDYYVNSNSTTYLQHDVKEELTDESNETGSNQGSKSEEPNGNVGRGSPESNAEQFIDRSSSKVGRDSGSRHSGTGYGNDIRKQETRRNSDAPSSDDSSVSNGQISGSFEQNDSKTGDGLRLQNLHEREVDNGISENHGSNEQLGYGNERRDGLNTSRYEEIARLLAAKLKEGATQEYLEYLQNSNNLDESEAASLALLDDTYSDVKITDGLWKNIAENLIKEAQKTYQNNFIPVMSENGITEDEINLLLNKNNLNPWYKKLSEQQKEIVLSDMRINPDLIGEYHAELDEKNISYKEYDKPSKEWLIEKINYRNTDGEFSYFNKNNAGQKRHYEEVFEYEKASKIVSENLTKSESRDIRKDVKELLSTHSDEEIKSNEEWLKLLSMYEGGGG